MAILSFGNKRLFIKNNFINLTLPSESPATTRMQNFWTAINMYIADWDMLPNSQAELSSYMSFTSEGSYNFSYTYVNSEIGYFNAQSTYNLIHSFTRTVSWDTGTLNNIICKKLGKVPPGQADYTEGVLSCQIGTEEG